MNYSTAKTILQIFRRERRISRVSKKLKSTKKSQRREKLLAFTLTEYKVQRFISFILNEECNFNSQNSVGRKRGHGLSETSSLTEPRRIFATVKVSWEGAGGGDVGKRAKLAQAWLSSQKTNKAVQTDIKFEDIPVKKKDIFYVYSDRDLEDEYRKRIDYDNPVLLKAKAEKQVSKAKDTSVSRTEKTETGFSFTEYGPKILSDYYRRHEVAQWS